LINKLVLENLRHRPIRTLLSTIAIGVQVTMVLTLVGVSHGLLDDAARRARGVGADILIQAPGSSLIGFNLGFPQKFLDFFRKQPHVAAVAGVLIQPIGGLNSMAGIDPKEFNAVSGGFDFIEGHTFRSPDDILIDQIYARANKLHVGDTVKLANHNWHVAGVVEAGKLSRIFAQRSVLQDLFSNTGKITMAYVRLDKPSETTEVIRELKQQLKDFPIYSMADVTSLFSINNVPMLKQFIWVVITLGVLVGFLVVFLSMYTAVLERTREVGILKALGASPGYILSALLRETALLAMAGSLAGIGFTYGVKWLLYTFVPTILQVIVYDWWPIAAGIAMVGALLGALYPGWKAAKQDPIEALSYD
jgi:putative ABC transport system permease protein